jgi:hypothetical protein
VRRFFPLLGMLLLIGCGPTVQISPPAYSDVQETGLITVTIKEDHSLTGQPVVYLFPKFQPTLVKNLSSSLKQVKPGEYNLTLPALQANEYRIVMEVPYTTTIAGVSINSGTVRTISDFVIHESLPASCFRFENKEKDLMEWSSHGVYIKNRDKPISKETCPGLFYVTSSWPYPLNENSHGGSLFVPVSSECFPKTSPQLSEPSEWTFAFVSPDLSNRQDWQHLHAIRFHMATRTINVTVQPEIQFTRDQIKYSYVSDAQTQSQYDVSGGRWNNFEYNFNLPDDARITHLIFHVYGVPEKTVSDQVDSVYLDAICPVK